MKILITAVIPKPTSINKRDIAFKLRVAAIKAYKKITGCGLKDAYDAITYKDSLKYT